MEIQQLDILLRLIIAHLLADFIFQTDRIARKKKNGLRSWHFYVHILIVGILTYVILAMWSNWWAPLLMTLMHGFIDWLKTKIKSDNAWGFLVDQILHIISVLILWVLLSENTVETIWVAFAENIIDEKTLLVITAYLTVSFPTGVLTGYLTKKWQKEIQSSGNNESLTDAGKWIGIVERLLILTFIIIHQWSSIGFLLAAKSVFRFGDLRKGKDRKKTEYILIGTFLSFAFAIAVGIFVNFFLHSSKFIF